jgi:hypothetical protein
MPLLISAGFLQLLWELGLLPCSCSQTSLLYMHITESLAPCPTLVLPGRGQVQSSTPTSAVGVRLQFPDYVFPLLLWGGGGRLVCPGAVLDYFPRGWTGFSPYCFRLCTLGAGHGQSYSIAQDFLNTPLMTRAAMEPQSSSLSS